MNLRIYSICGKVHDALCCLAERVTDFRKRVAIRRIRDLLELRSEERLRGRLQEEIENYLETYYMAVTGEWAR